MLRAVLDANVYVSAYVRPEGPPGQIVERLLRDAAFEVILSAAIVEEVLQSLAYPKVLKSARTRVDGDLWFEDIVVLAQLVPGDYEVLGVSEDSDDDKYIAAAIEGRATFVVSGDPDLLDVKEHQGVRIITPRAFLRALILFLLLIMRVDIAQAQDWPEFRGPDGQGHSAEQGLPLEWSESRNVDWKTAVPGTGWSSPVVAGGRVWLTTAVQGGDARKSRAVSLRVLAFDVTTGREIVNVELFRVERPGLINSKNSRASPTPILSGDRVYVHFGADGTAALTASGDVLWRTRLGYESQHGNGGSPALYGDLLIVNIDGDSPEAYVAALDTRTGKIRWKTSRRAPFAQAYTTPLVIRVADRDQVVSVGAFRTVAYDPQSGKEIWRVSYDDGFSNVPRPVYGHGLVYIVSGWTSPPRLLAVRPDGTGDVTKTHVAWTLRRGVPYISSPLLVGDEIYVVNDNGILTCLDAGTGAVHWQQRLGGNYAASPVFADGRIYFQSEEGVTTVIAPGREFRRLALNQLEGSMLASMAVSGGSLFIRTDTHLYRITERP